MTVVPEIRPMPKDQLTAAVATAARAFYDDPLFNFFQPNLVKQLRDLPGLMKATILGAPADDVHVALVRGKAKGVAAWMPPGSYPRPARQEAMFYVRGLPSMVRTGRRLPDALKLLTAIDKMHTKVEHWYLALLAVDPELQGQGVGRALIEPTLARCDAEGLPAYLETQKESNVAWYGRAGFEVVDTIKLPKPGTPTMWTLLREPR